MLSAPLPPETVPWTLQPGVSASHLGMIPLWFILGDPRPALEQVKRGYSMTGGAPFEGSVVKFEMVKRGQIYELRYADDPPMREMARTTVNGSTVVLFEGEWLSVIEPDGSHVTDRVD